MLNRKSLFDMSFGSKEFAVFQEYISNSALLMERAQQSRNNSSEEPFNPPVSVEALNLTNFPKPAVKHGLLKSIISYGLEKSGLTPTTKNLTDGNYQIVAGVPAGDTPNCNVNYWIACAEAFVANETNVIARFMYASKKALENVASDATAGVAQCIALTTDPLMQVLNLVQKRIPVLNWFGNNTQPFNLSIIESGLNLEAFGNSTAISPEAGEAFQVYGTGVAQSCMLSYYNDQPIDYKYGTKDYVMLGAITAAIIVFELGAYAAFRYMQKQNTRVREVLNEEDQLRPQAVAPS